MTCILWFFAGNQVLCSWSMGAVLGAFGSAWLAWRFGPQTEKLTARAWLYRWQLSLAMKWLWAALMLALFYRLAGSGVQLLWLWAGYGIMCVTHGMVFFRDRYRDRSRV